MWQAGVIRTSHTSEGQWTQQMQSSACDGGCGVVLCEASSDRTSILMINFTDRSCIDQKLHDFSLKHTQNVKALLDISTSATSEETVLNKYLFSREAWPSNATISNLRTPQADYSSSFLSSKADSWTQIKTEFHQITQNVSKSQSLSNSDFCFTLSSSLSLPISVSYYNSQGSLLTRPYIHHHPSCFMFPTSLMFINQSVFLHLPWGLTSYISHVSRRQ